MMKHSLSLAALFSLLLLALPVQAESMSEGSTTLSTGSAFVVVGTMSAVVGAGEIVVDSVKVVGDSTEVVVKNLANGASVTLKLASQGVGAVSLGVGTAVQFTAEATGYAFSTAGRLIAFVPNEMGKSLLYHSSAN